MTTKIFFIIFYSILPYIIHPQEVSEQSTHYFYNSILMVDTLTIHRLEKTTFLALKRAIKVDLLLIFSVIIASRKLKESVPRGLGLQINLPVLKLPMRHKLCLALYSTAVGDISRPLL